jgi:hypothetical protein
VQSPIRVWPVSASFSAYGEASFLAHHEAQTKINGPRKSMLQHCFPREMYPSRQVAGLAGTIDACYVSFAPVQHWGPPVRLRHRCCDACPAGSHTVGGRVRGQSCPRSQEPAANRVPVTPIRIGRQSRPFPQRCVLRGGRGPAPVPAEMPLPQEREAREGVRQGGGVKGREEDNAHVAQNSTSEW